MPQWDYHKIDLNGLPRKTEDIDVLHDAGKDGWELIVITPNNIAYLKRQLQEPTQAAQTVAQSTRRRTPTSGT